MDVLVIATAFALVLPVELPDKTFVATLVLATRFPWLPVWGGVSAAFLAQTLIAVAAGSLLALLPRTPVLFAAALLFTVGGIFLLRTAARADEEEQEGERAFAARGPASARGLHAAAASFGVLFVAEWGDLSQLLTAGMAARTGEPLSVLIGAWAALVAVAGAAVLLGRTLLRHVRLAMIRRIAGGVCLTLAAVTAAQASGLI